MKQIINRFLEIYAREDHPEITKQEQDKLMETNFYYITEDLEGYFVPKNLSYKLSNEEQLVYKIIVEDKEG
jgi:hypothetical protein